MYNGGKLTASCSFGKDSLAAIIVAIEQMHLEIDEVLYCRIMFDKDTSAELPEHEEWIYSHAIPRLKELYGLDTTIVQSEKNYLEWYYTVRSAKSKYPGTIYGFPNIFPGGWCNASLKREPIKKHQKNDTIGGGEIIGIAYDEPERAQKPTLQKTSKQRKIILPLYENEITEAQALEICKEHDLLSPAYKFTQRLGCWFCNRQTRKSLRDIYKRYPQLWKKLLDIDNDSPPKTTFIPDGKTTVHDLDARFAKEEEIERNQTRLF